MKTFTQPGDFPLTDTWSYLNAANVALMPMSATRVMTDWQTDVAQNGSNNFNDHAEDTAFDGLREQGAKLFGCRQEEKKRKCERKEVKWEKISGSQLYCLSAPTTPPH